VLAECEAKWRIVALVQTAHDEGARDSDSALANAIYGARASLGGAMLRSLALSYADRDGYQEEWRPQPHPKTVMVL